MSVLLFGMPEANEPWVAECALQEKPAFFLVEKSRFFVEEESQSTNTKRGWPFGSQCVQGCIRVERSTKGGWKPCETEKNTFSAIRIR